MPKNNAYDDYDDEDVEKDDQPEEGNDDISLGDDPYGGLAEETDEGTEVEPEAFMVDQPDAGEPAQAPKAGESPKFSDDEVFAHVLKAKFDPNSKEYKDRVNQEASRNQAARDESDKLSRQGRMYGLMDAMGHNAPIVSWGKELPGTGVDPQGVIDSYQKKSQDVLNRNEDVQAREKAKQDQELFNYLKFGHDEQYRNAMLDLQKKKVAAAGAKTANQPTVAEKKIDEKFGEDYADYVTKGGYANVKTQLDALKKTRDSLVNKEGISGPKIGYLEHWSPETRTAMYPESTLAQQNVETSILRSAKAIFGARVGQQELLALVKTGFDPGLPPEKNIEKIDRLIEQLEAAAKSKNDAIDYYKKNRTLNGYQGGVPDINGFAAGAPSGSTGLENNQPPNTANAGPMSQDKKKELPKIVKHPKTGKDLYLHKDGKYYSKPE